MKSRSLTIFALLAATVIAAALASALTVTISRVPKAGAIVVTLTDSKTNVGHWAEGAAARSKGGVALLLCDLPAGFYSAVVLARE